jgi:hypothetical protein
MQYSPLGGTRAALMYPIVSCFAISARRALPLRVEEGEEEEEEGGEIPPPKSPFSSPITLCGR